MYSEIIMNEYKLNPKDFMICQKIKQGGFDNVVQIHNKNTRIYYVAKILERDKYNQEMIDQEISKRIKANHSTINKFIGFYDENPKTVFLVMEQSKNNSLFDILSKPSEVLPTSFNNTTRQIILVGVAYAMMYLHQNFMYHPSLTPESILLDQNYNPCITDFEFETASNQSIKVPIYTAPECFEGKGISDKSDVYSYAIIMYQIITHKDPFPQVTSGEMSEEQFKSDVVNNNLRPKIPDDMNWAFAEFLPKCWSSDPMERPTFKEIYKKLYYDFNYHLDDVDTTKLFRYVTKIEIDSKNEESMIKNNKVSKNPSDIKANKPKLQLHK